MENPAARVKPPNVDELQWREAMQRAGGPDNPDRLWPVLAQGFTDLLARWVGGRLGVGDCGLLYVGRQSCLACGAGGGAASLYGLAGSQCACGQLACRAALVCPASIRLLLRPLPAGRRPRTRQCRSTRHGWSL